MPLLLLQIRNLINQSEFEAKDVVNGKREKTRINQITWVWFGT